MGAGQFIGHVRPDRVDHDAEGVETWLGGAISASVDGKIMTVLDESGQSIGTLVGVE